MTTKHNIIIIAASVVIAAVIPFLYKSNQEDKINYQVFRSAGGWGYNIIVNSKLIIHQEYIPAIAEKKEFPTETEAIKTAQLVVHKLKNNKLPTISGAEVDQICRDNSR